MMLSTEFEIFPIFWYDMLWDEDIGTSNFGTDDKIDHQTYNATLK